MKHMLRFIVLFTVLSLSFVYAAEDTLSFTITVTENLPDWANLQYPGGGAGILGEDFFVYGQVYEPGVTDASGEGSAITAQVGISTADTDPSGTGWTWYEAVYNTDSGNNDEYMLNLKNVITEAGVYYVATRYSLDGTNWVYGGYSEGGGGFWDGSSNVSIQVTFERGNDAPVLIAPATLAMTEDTPHQLTLRATDADDDPVSFAVWGGSAETVQPSLSQDSILTLTPAENFFTNPGDTIHIYARAYDAFLGADTVHMKVTVAGVNDVPVIAARNDTSAMEGETLTFTLTAEDADGESLTWSSQNLPEGATFTDHQNNTATFSWTPNYGQAGVYKEILFIVTDGAGAKGVMRVAPSRQRKPGNVR